MAKKTRLLIEKLRNWKYANIVRGSVFLMFAILEIINGGSLRFFLAIGMIIIAIMCFWDKKFLE